MDHDERYTQDYNNNTVDLQDHDWQPPPGPSSSSTRNPPQNTINESTAPSFHFEYFSTNNNTNPQDHDWQPPPGGPGPSSSSTRNPPQNMFISQNTINESTAPSSYPFNYYNTPSSPATWNAFAHSAYNYNRQYSPLPRHLPPNPTNSLPPLPPYSNPYESTSQTPLQMPNFRLSPETGSWWYNMDGAGAAGPSGTAGSANTLFSADVEDGEFDELDELEYNDDDEGGLFIPDQDDEETIHMQAVSDQLIPPQNSAHLELYDDDAVDEKKNILTAKAKGKGKQKAVATPSPTPSPNSSQSDTIPATILSAHALSSYTCPICFCPPTNATMTPCGHVACGSCLFTAIKTSMKREAYYMGRDDEGGPRCPVCRAIIVGWDGKGKGVIGLVARTRTVI